MAISSHEKKLLAVSVLAIALPLGIVLYGKRINATPVVNIQPYPTLPQPNGFDLYVAAANTITPPVKPSMRPVSDGTIPNYAKVWAQRYSLAGKTAWLNANAKGFALFDEAMKTPTLSLPTRSWKLGFPYYARLREMARYKTIQSNERWLRNDFYGAFKSGLDSIQMGHDTRHGSAIMGTSVGIAYGAMGRSVADDTVEHLDAMQAKTAARRIEHLLDTRWKIEQVLSEDKIVAQSGALEKFQSQDWRSASLVPTNTLSERWRAHTISKQQIIDDIGQEYDRQIANARLPYSQKGTSLPDYSDPIVELFANSIDLRCSDARDLAGDRLLMLRLALRAYRVENGAYPLQLKALVPRYLQAIPADPFGNGEAMHFKSDGQTQTLWSIGPDGKDDNGTPIPYSGKSPAQAPDGREQLPWISLDSVGDIVAGKNR